MAPRIYSDSEWRKLILADAEGYALESDSVLATRHQTTRQTIYAVRKRLGIQSLREYRRTHEARREVRIGVDVTQDELTAIDTHAKRLGLSRSSYLGAAGAMPETADLLAQALHKSSAPASELGMAKPPDQVQVGQAAAGEPEA